MQLEVSIIIINFNTVELTLACIASIQQHTKSIPYEIILIDNYPKSDYSTTFKHRFPEIMYHRSDENLGFGKANNLGMSMARGKYFLLLNSDTLFVEDSLAKTINYLEEHNEVNMLGCRLENPDRSYQASFYPFTKHNFWNFCASNNPLLYRLFKIQEYYQAPECVTSVGDISGAFMLLRRELYVETKGFDPDFFLYYEESDWCRNRIRPKNLIHYFPNTSVVHIGGQSAPSALMQIQGMISQGLFWYKNSLISFMGFLLFQLINMPISLLLIPFVSDKKQIIQQIKNTLIALPYWLANIPSYPRTWGARKRPLVYRKARRLFFGSGT